MLAQHWSGDGCRRSQTWVRRGARPCCGILSFKKAWLQQTRGDVALPGELCSLFELFQWLL
eukprot:1569757-Alexandrium_andersonii.AAC.1